MESLKGDQTDKNTSPTIHNNHILKLGLLMEVM